MIYYVLKQNKMTGNLVAYEKWYARPVTGESIDLDALAEHMANHNTPYSKGAIMGILTDMIACVKELVLDGKTVVVDNLAAFSVGIVNKKGCEDPADYKVSEYVEGVKLRCRAVGEFTRSSLNLEASLKRSALDPLLTGTSTIVDDSSEFEDDDDQLTHLED
jgi:predicted histone-like DNA-binding protein